LLTFYRHFHFPLLQSLAFVDFFSPPSSSFFMSKICLNSFEIKFHIWIDKHYEDDFLFFFGCKKRHFSLDFVFTMTLFDFKELENTF
jgi:hypothetical protein